MFRRFCFVAVLATASASAALVTLDFEGLLDGEGVANFYNGGTGSIGPALGPNYGIVFDVDSLALIDIDAGGTGIFENEPSPSTVLFFINNTNATMNVAAGFTGSLNFSYTATDVGGSVSIFDGLNGTGNLLATLALPALGACTDPFNLYCNWAGIGIAFAGTARSVDFGGSANLIGFDSVQINTGAAVVPEPATFVLMGAGLIGLVSWKRRR